MYDLEITYSIGDTAGLTGVTTRQIRNWGESGHLGTVERIQCGDRAYRRYTSGQVELIQRIKGYLDEGFTLKMAVQKAGEKKSVKEGEDYAE